MVGIATSVARHLQLYNQLFGDTAVKIGLIDKAQLAKARMHQERLQAKTKIGIPLGKVMVQLGYLTESADNVRQSLELSTIQYTEGAIDFLIVDIAAVNLTRQQDSQASVEGLVALNLISAYKALGGGWELRLGSEFIPEAMIEAMRDRTNWGNVLVDPNPDYGSGTDLGFKRPGDTDDTYLAPPGTEAGVPS